MITVADSLRLRNRVWNIRYPNCMDDITEIFDGQVPSVKEVAKWKCTWNQTTSNMIEIGHSTIQLGRHGQFGNTCEQCGIHPYLWDTVTTDHLTKMVSFYYEEHLIMFKLAWQE